jgi:hypothetical protein
MPTMNQTHTKPYILFHSMHCSFCEDIVKSIVSSQLRDQVAMMCIDNMRSNLPNWLDCVPIMMNIEDKTLYRGIDNVTSVLNSLFTVQNEEPETFFGQGTKYSDMFSVIDDADNETSRGLFSSCYSSVDDNHRIMTVDEQPSNNAQHGTAKPGGQLENLVAEREKQIQNVFGDDRAIAGGGMRQRVG